MMKSLIAVLCATTLASSSAFSFPSILECVSTHTKSILFEFASFLIVYQYSKAKADLSVTADRAFRAASLSEQLKIISFVDTSVNNRVATSYYSSNFRKEYEYFPNGMYSPKCSFWLFTILLRLPNFVPNETIAGARKFCNVVVVSWILSVNIREFVILFLIGFQKYINIKKIKIVEIK